MKIGPLEIKFFEDKEGARTNRELGASGTTIYGGYLDSEEYVSELSGSKAFTTYNKMRRSDSVVGAALLVCELPIRATKWYVKPATEEKKDKEVASFVSDCLFKKMSITWDDFLRQALLMLPYGVMVFEKVFKADSFEGKDMIAWKKLAPRLPDTIFKWKTESGEDGVVQRTLEKGKVSIPIEKLLIFSYRKEGDNWRGIPILRQAYRPWFFKNHIEKINAISIERQGLGIPYAKMEGGWTDKDKEEAKELLKNIRAHEEAYLIEPEGMEIGFKDMKARTTRDPKDSIERYNRAIFISVLAQFLDLGSSKSGSYALSKEQSTTFHNNLMAIARQMKNVINKYAVKQIVDLNYNVEEYPTLEFGHIGEVDYESISKALYWLTGKGVITPDERLEEYVRNLLDLPKLPEEERDVKKKSREVKPKEKVKGSEFTSFRPLTFAEQKVKFADLKEKIDKAERKLKESVESIARKMKSEEMKKVREVLNSSEGTRRIEEVKSLTLKYKGEYGREVQKKAKEVFEYGKMMAAHEMKKSVPPTTTEMNSLISQQAIMSGDIISSDMIGEGRRMVANGLSQKLTEAEIMRKLAGALEKVKQKAVNNTPSITVGGSINQGRRATFDYYEDEIYALQRSEVLDERTCNYCLSIDKRVLAKDDPFTKVNQVHTNCRGIWVEVLKTEKIKPEITEIPSGLKERFEGRNRFEQPTVPVVKPDSSAEKFYGKDRLEKEIRERIEEIYDKGSDMKVEIDLVVDKVSSEFNGWTAKAPLKNKETAIKKVLYRKGGDVDALNDVARNTVIVRRAEDMDKVGEAIAKRIPIAQISEYDGRGPLGYVGKNFKVATSAGFKAEIQTNTPEMIWAKEKPEIAKAILGEDLWNEVGRKVGDLEPGLGHKFYEEWREELARDTINEKVSREIERKSQEYYEEVRRRYHVG